MTVTRRHSPLSLWTLCLAVLLGAHLCGLHHGQASGLALSGLQGGYCSVDPAGFAPVPIEQAEPDGEWSCPLCQNPATTDGGWPPALGLRGERSEEHTSELQSRENLVCRLLLEKKKNFK